MRKAFDANVPKLKPRLKGAAPAAVALPLEAVVEEAPHAVRVPFEREAAEPTATLAPTPTAPRAARPEPVEGRAPESRSRFDELSVSGGTSTPPSTAAVAEKISAAIAAKPAAAEVDDLGSRRARLDKIKARVAEHARPAVRPEPPPASPAAAAEKVLGLARDLEQELGRARERELALQADLEAARADGARAADEAHQAGEALGAASRELDEKRTVLADLLAEMNALEAERDEALRRAQAVAALDEERARLLEDLSRRADEEARARGSAEAEVTRLTEELRETATDGARLRAALAEVARERDQLAGDLLSLRRERQDLDAAKKALEQVHTALSQARARIG